MAVIDRIITYAKAAMTAAQRAAGATRVVAYNPTTSKIVYPDGTVSDAPIAVSYGTGVTTFLTTPSSANLKAALTDETGSGSAVFATSPTFITPVLGAATGTSLNLGTDSTLRTPPVLGSAVGTLAQISTTGFGGFALTRWVSTAAGANALVFARSKSGVFGTMTAVASGDATGYISFSGTDGTNFIEGARITSSVDGAVSTNRMPSKLQIHTAPAGSTTLNLAQEWNATQQSLFSGDALAVGASSSMGFGTGSGGSVTQATSRTTGVTLNKSNGAITLVSAAGVATWTSFTVTNSLVAATDVIRVCQKSGTNLYLIHVTAVASGSFQVSFATSGGTATDAPVFSFAVCKAVTA
jgi:hypothetical protein